MKGVYIIDILLILLFCFVLLKVLRKKVNLDVLRKNALILPISVLFLLIAISCGISLIANPSFLREIYDISRLGVYMTKEGASMIAFVQIKAFSYLLVMFFITIFTLDSRDKIAIYIYIFLAFTGVNLLQGVNRFLGKPSEFLQNIVPLFSDLTTSLIFAVFIFLVSSLIIFKVRREIYFKLIAFVAIAFSLMCIAFSFRRALWGAFILAMAIYIVVLPSRQRNLFLFFFGILSLIAVTALMITGGPEVAFKAIEGRVGQTSLREGSTAYRVAIFTDMGSRIFTIPIFGYGTLPFWNYTVVYRNLITNLENIHSIYFWLILRFGFLGLLAFFWYVYRAIKCSFWIYWRSTIPFFKAVGISIGLAFIMIMVVGLSTPSYGQARHMIFMGIITGILANLYSFARKEPASKIDEGKTYVLGA